MAHDLIVFSHVRWDFVFQRPQQLITRLARNRRIFYFQEPVEAESGAPALHCSESYPNVFVCQPVTPVKADGFHDLQLPYLKAILDELIQRFEVQQWAAWFYTPMALPLVAGVSPAAIIYDCLNEPASRQQSPRQFQQREAALMKVADVVFTSSPGQHEAKRDAHPRVYHAPGSVDAGHFGRARQGVTEPLEQARLARPRLGYFGVIDERVDLSLIDALARSHPDWQIILVGPVVKLEPDTLPLHSNIYYFGHQDYGELPGFLAGWDVCLLPLAQNPATRFMSPSKTLEYMVAERPIVSTAIPDIAGLYGDIVYVCDSHDAFGIACEQALAMSDEQRLRMIAKMHSVLSHTSWDTTAASIDGLVASVIQEKQFAETLSQGAAPVQDQQPLPGDTLPPPVLHERIRSVPVAVLGAGPAGLSAAWHLGDQALLIDQEPEVGGRGRSVREAGFTFDCAGPGMYACDSYISEMYDTLLGDNVRWQDREDWIFSHGVHTRCPFHSALHGLPVEVIRECILGAVEARFGPAATPHTQSGGENDGPADRSALKSVTLPFRNRRRKPRNFADFIAATWGTGIARHFAEPYYSKLWATPLQDLEAPTIKGPAPVPDLDEMVESALKPARHSSGLQSRFGYPVYGGFQALMSNFIPRLNGKLRLGSAVVNIAPAEHLLTLEDGSIYSYESLISALPLPDLLQTLAEALPDAVREAADGLRYLSVRWVNLGIGRENVTDKHWIHYPGDTLFHRVFAQGNASPQSNAPGGFGLSCEIAYSSQRPLPSDNGDALVARCVHDCIKVGLLRAEDPVWVTHQVDLPHVAVVPDHNSAQHLESIRNWLGRYDITLTGLGSPWNYEDSEHPFLIGRQAARQVQAAREGRSAAG